MSPMIKQQLTLRDNHHNQRLDLVLAQLLPDFSRSQISEWIKSGGVLRNNHACKPKDKAISGDEISIAVDFSPPSANLNECAPENIPLDIIYEDEAILVLNKSAGLVVHPGAGNREHTLVNALLYHAPALQQLPRAGIVHRLDKDTTGLLVVAKNWQAHTSLIRQMQARTVKRQYLCLVQGNLNKSATLETGFGRNPKNRLKMAVLETGKQAITHYKPSKQYEAFTLLEVQLMTGRTHQIRVHAAYLGHPVVGDQLYGSRLPHLPEADANLIQQLQSFKRQALHACSLSFEHPETGEICSFQAPLPEDFSSLLLTLDTYYGL